MRENTDAERLDYLAMLLEACPHAEISFNDDPDTEDDRGILVPIGWRIFVEGCETSDVVAPTLRQAIDLEIAMTAARERRHLS